MVKTFIGIIGLIVAGLVSGWCYRYAEQKQTAIPPFNTALIGFAMTLFLEIVLIVILDSIGWYPD